LKRLIEKIERRMNGMGMKEKRGKICAYFREKRQAAHVAGSCGGGITSLLF